MNSGLSLTRLRMLPQAARILRAIGPLLCLLALSTLVSRASFGPIGALMLVVLALGIGATLGIPLDREGRELAVPAKSRGH